MNVLVIDDESPSRCLLRTALESVGYRVSEAENGRAGIGELARSRPDAVILAFGLPDMDGVQVIRRIREWSRVPILVLGVADEVAAKVLALDAGADDCVSKPFHAVELLARLRAIGRRSEAAGEGGSEFVCGPLRIDYAERAVYLGGRKVRLTPKEYSVLRILTRNVGKVVTHRHLSQEIWGAKAGRRGNDLRVHIVHLRRKLVGAGLDRGHLRTEARVGYRFVG